MRSWLLPALKSRAVIVRSLRDQDWNQVQPATDPSNRLRQELTRSRQVELRRGRGPAPRAALQVPARLRPSLERCLRPRLQRRLSPELAPHRRPPIPPPLQAVARERRQVWPRVWAGAESVSSPFPASRWQTRSHAPDGSANA